MGVFGTTRLDEYVKRRRLDNTGREYEHSTPWAKQWLGDMNRLAKVVQRYSDIHYEVYGHRPDLDCTTGWHDTQHIAY
eukprot:5459354-Pyramimonas_sp.AAC.1